MTALVARLLAHPAGHSLSPVMHNAAFAALGLEALYEARDVPPEQLAAEVGLMRADERVLGLNLSLPHKEAVLDLLDGLDDAARAIGAVNTVVRSGGGLRGLNTDAPVFWPRSPMEVATRAGKRCWCSAQAGRRGPWCSLYWGAARG